MDLFSITSLLAICSTLILAFRPKLVWIVIKTLPRDIKLIWVFIKLNVYVIYKLKTNSTIPKSFRNTVRRNPKKVAIYFEEEKWTFEQVDEYTNRIGNYFKSLGYKRGDNIALLLDSRPEFICLWLGLAKVGIVTALINTNIMSKESLTHALKSGNSNTIIFGSRFKKVVENATTVNPELKMFQFNDQPADLSPKAIDLKTKLQESSFNSLDFDIDMGKSDDKLVYIYTSGTTGFPKASVIRNFRYNLAFLTFNLGVNIKTEDILYIPVPLYHSLGGMAGTSQCLIKGTSIVIRTKFSASNFWKDCEKYKCTISQYIGEMARYVILAHRNSQEKPSYRLPKMFGNGMKPTTWKQFVENFNVGQIYEFYGSTEGNFGLFNLDNTVGSIGYCPLYGDYFVPMALIKCNASGEPIRNDEGFCDICEFDEPGLMVCKISKLLPLTKFDGYSDSESTKKKILENVLRKGDMYFNTGDVLVRDDHGYFYFRDRTGDTFRWKGENVSTNEVEDILSSVIQRDVAVYGVEIPGSEGKAGMAALADPNKTLDLKRFLEACQSNLPSYSVPIFLRIVDEIKETGTFKIQKVDYQKEGFNIDLVKDKVYFLDPKRKEYVEVERELYNDICNCQVRV